MIEKIVLFIGLLMCLSFFLVLFMLSSENNYHYAYIDMNDNLGVSARCRRNQCEDLDFNVIYVKSYIDIREK